jgi:hypothetical protein
MRRLVLVLITVLLMCSTTFAVIPPIKSFGVSDVGFIAGDGEVWARVQGHAIWENAFFGGQVGMMGVNGSLANINSGDTFLGAFVGWKPQLNINGLVAEPWLAGNFSWGIREGGFSYGPEAGIDLPLFGSWKFTAVEQYRWFTGDAERFGDGFKTLVGIKYNF